MFHIGFRRLAVVLGLLLASTPDSYADGRSHGLASAPQPAAAGSAGGSARQVPLAASAPDGSGGTIVVWEDFRDGSTADIYAQRVDAAGVPLWGEGGVAVCVSGGHQRNPQVASDGSGGAYITWDDVFDVSVQHVSAAGVPLWGACGIGVCVAPGDQTYAQVMADGTGGVFVVWLDARMHYYDVYAQRLDAAGVPLWTPDGMAIYTSMEAWSRPQMVLDGAGGAIVAWSASDNSDYASVVAQRITAAGGLAWGGGGIAICTTTDYQTIGGIAADEAGGAVIVWRDSRGACAQRLGPTGAKQWPASGVVVSDLATNPQVVSSGAGGAIVVWEDLGAPANTDIHAQRLTPAGILQWAREGVPICAAANLQASPQVAPDGAGGALVAWQDYRSGRDADIYAQRVDSTGSRLWAADGRVLCSAPGDQFLPQVVADGTGGAIVSWYDRRDGAHDDEYLQSSFQSPVAWWTVHDVYAQRVSGTGAPMWTADGAGVHVQPGLQNYPASCVDGAGGVFIAWQEKQGGGYDIYVRRFDAAGIPAWPAVLVCAAPNTQLYPDIVADGAGGAIVSWQDARAGEYDVYAQRVDAAGVPQWTPNGVPLCAEARHQRFPKMVSDGAGGAIVTWEDFRGGSYYTSDIYAQRVSATGMPQWTADGVALSAAAGQQMNPQIVSDGAGGAIVTWHSFANGAMYISDIFVRRVNAAGVPLWTPDGVALCTADGEQSTPQIASDGAGGAIVVWSDQRADVFARRVSAAGVALWALDGVPVCIAVDQQANPRIVSDGTGGAVIAWDDWRGTSVDIYAGRVNSAGVLQWPASGVALCTSPGDQTRPRLAPSGAGGAIIVWEDHRGGESADIYARRVSATGVPQWTENGEAVCTASGLQWVPTIATDGAGGVFVAWADRRDRVQDVVYGQRVTPGGVLTWGTDGATPALVSLAGAETWPGRVRLTWYSPGAFGVGGTVYRADPGAGFRAVANVFGDGGGRFTHEDDSVAPGRRYGFRIGVREGNLERLSEETWVEVPVAPGLALATRSNPARGDLTVAFSLGDATPARLELFDLAGRRIVARDVGPLGAGSHVMTLGNGRALAVGQYVVRLSQGTRSLTARGVILR